MENALISENKQATLQIEDNPSGQKLLDKRRRGTPCSHLEDFLICIEERRDERDFLQQIPLSFLYCSFVNASMIGKRYVGIDRDAARGAAVYIVSRS
jgi:hypothetical protein